MYEIITLELNYSSHAWRLVSPYHIVASPHLAWFWLYCCVPHKIFSISSNSLRPVCFDRRNAARPPGSRLNILSDTNSGFYSIRNPADTHCCPSRTNPAFLLVGWCHTGLAKTPICQQPPIRSSKNSFVHYFLFLGRTTKLKKQPYSTVRYSTVRRTHWYIR